MRIAKVNDQSDLTRVFDDFFNTGMDRIKNFYAPSVNISEEEKEYTIEVAAPGKEKSDFNVSLFDNVLTISSTSENKSEEKQSTDKNYIHQEYSYSAFERSFVLSDDIDQENIDAKYDKGVLNITLPKKEIAQKKNKSIAIS
ncbi:Hsp20/alpha crystallin family protein [Bacteroidales bacterium OttesenSCG-928-K03]|nr:Hsp20/alpha crystallin family protein [Odoribacter sp. OttesenSCG-928-L07]MDL2239371.1 Hsp20/alpha crystallin family protein [Bacteroidales bacterium OttesenSCG-928-L14]MDL2240586.1 Hsp20/alpha crystallin family protein [Bacteroidales bacterium OttesenSCG-928-K22]MDL2242353.1 Hsp20/alpha crystallin family protein [Bacteroidales bacterium OttesenSCG-928-K03]